MTTTLEREGKLRFADSAEARDAILGAGATPLKSRRLQEDSLLDTPDGRLRSRGSLLRIRMECGKSFITLKGPEQPSTMALREELETIAGDGPQLIRIFEELGFEVCVVDSYRGLFARHCAQHGLPVGDMLF